MAALAASMTHGSKRGVETDDSVGACWTPQPPPRGVSPALPPDHPLAAKFAELQLARAVSRRHLVGTLSALTHRQEEVYGRAPLGRAVSRGSAPAAVHSGELVFGKSPAAADEAQTKELLLPSAPLWSTPPAAREPGYQAGRDAVNWQSAALSRDARLGAPPSREVDGVLTALRAAPPPGGAAENRVQAFKQRFAAEDADAARRAQEAVRPSTSARGCEAGSLIRGEGLIVDQPSPPPPPPSALTGQAALGRTFGAPTIRAAAPPERRSLADTRAYDDEPRIGSLLQPGISAAPPGTALRLSRWQTVELYADAGIPLSAAQVDALFAAAAEEAGCEASETMELAAVQRARERAGI